ncbi:TetR/AcrR family transcriptional regulator [Gordonia terrae]|uniref:TetR/AcrR family transcriptional regulator n=1 Tax=Gordonia terrae TaxID=2055 RepID=A0AAD0NXZ5_9ACTN|nr:TetR/AcrR family transcriptional regulator [Gordonia terrae]
MFADLTDRCSLCHVTTHHEAAPATVDWTPKARLILDAASSLFYERGIHAVGVDSIAEAAGVTKRTLYDRFGSKEQLVVEYLRARNATWKEFLRSRLDAADATPGAQLSAVFDATRDWSADRGHKGCAMINAHAEISDPDHPAYPIIVGQKYELRDLLRSVAANAGVSDGNTLAQRLFILHEGALVTAGMGVEPDALDAARDVALEMLASQQPN